MTLAEELEQTGQDAARFRWMCENPRLALSLFVYIEHADKEDAMRYARVEIDGFRDTTVAPPGALYVES